MNKKEYKRYTRIKREIELWSTYLEDLLELRQKLFDDGRDLNKILENKKRSSDVEDRLMKLRALRDRLLLPTCLKIEGGNLNLENICKDIGMKKTKSLLYDYVAMFLLDRYNRQEINGCYIMEKGEDILVSRIRWAKGQLLREDVKDLVKGKINKIENAFVKVYRHLDEYVVEDKLASANVPCAACKTHKEIIKELERIYVL